MDVGREDRKARRRRERRDRILEAAAGILLSEGRSALTASSLARASDMAPASLYHYVDSLQEVIDVLMLREMEREGLVMVAALSQLSGGVESLQGLVRAKIQHYRDQPATYQLLYGSLNALPLSEAVVQEQILPRTGEVFGVLEARISADQMRGRITLGLHPRMLANLAWCQAQGILVMADGARVAGTSTRFPLEDLGEEACRLIERACRP